ncbi:MAG: DUF6588 family protein [Balneolaceae bacterium]
MLTKQKRGKSLLFLFSLIFLSTAGLQTAKAQLGDVGEILRGGSTDSNLLLNEYLKPFGSGFGADLNSGWVNTARAYKPFGIDLRLTAAFSVVPDTDQLFDVTRLQFQELQILGGPNQSPTAFGEDIESTRLGKTYVNPQNGQEEELFGFLLPRGAGLPISAVPAPMAQLTVGIIKDTDVSLRYLPTLSVQPDQFDMGVDHFDIGMWGLGVKHGLNQWLPGGSLIPVDLSVQAGYTRLTSNTSFSVNPIVDQDTRNDFAASTWNGQGLQFKSTGFTGNVLVGKTLPLISIYGGLGFQSSQTIIKTPGSYPIITPIEYEPDEYEQGDPVKQIEKVDEPVDVELNGSNKFHAMAGLRIRLAILAISASYTVSDYPTLNVGVGLSFR